MARSLIVACALAAACVLLVVMTGVPVAARSSGIMSSCDLTPQWWPAVSTTTINGRQLWPNGRFGANYSSTKMPYLDTGNMRWVQAPIASSAYTIRSGDSSTVADPTSYTPGVPLTIHLKVSALKMRFIGLVLYGTNVTGGMLPTVIEKPIGDWQTIPGDEFQITDACPRTVTHTNANIKALHSRFLWSAPKGTGTVRFRVLIKQGEQNKGNFFWPAQELVLTEGSAPSASPSSRTVTGAPGQSCADKCYTSYPSSTQYCDGAAMLRITSTAALQTALKNLDTPVRMPLLAACAYAGTPQVSAEGYASFRATNVAATCPAAYVAAAAAATPQPQPDVCYTKPIASARSICICTSDASKQTPNPYRAGGLNVAQEEVFEPTTVQLFDGPVSAAAGPKSPIVALVLALVAAVSVKASRSSLLLVLVVAALCVLVTPTAAHNYIKTVHRANVASVANPCQTRVGTDPHIQVIPGQEFELEWSTGHGDYTTGPFWFVVVREADVHRLKSDNTTAQLKDYLALAPDAAILNGTRHEKHHIHNINECDPAAVFNPDPAAATTNTKTCQFDTYYKEANLTETHPDYIWRDPVSMAKAHPSRYQKPENVVQHRFQDQFLWRDANGKPLDKRASYQSAKYPWIESVSMFNNVFKNHYTVVDQSDIARFTVPARQGLGNYIVWFYWSGYMDCVDINVQPKSPGKTGFTSDGLVESRYGTLPTTTSPKKSVVVKLDHCEYTYVGSAATQCRQAPRVTRDVSQCVSECQKSGSCTNVQVVRWKNPTTTLDAVVNIPFSNYVYNQTVIDIASLRLGAACLLDPCMCQDVTSRVESGCKSVSTQCTMTGTRALPATLQDDDLICYGLNPLRNQDFQVEEDYRIASDPLDPMWYSTCYQFTDPGGFLNIPAYVYSPPDWDQADACVDCGFQTSLSALNLTQIPQWTQAVASTCQDCDIKNSFATTAQLQLAGANDVNGGAPPAGTVTASWSTGTAGTCSCSGMATRTVQCMQGSTVVADSMCTAAKPTTSVSCTAPAACTPSWSSGTAGSCSCSGTATVSVQCMQNSAVVADSMCTAAKPATSVSCTAPNSCATWSTGTASTCSCSGTATRTVQCTLNSAVVADSTCTAAKPATSVSCTKPASCSPSSSSTGSAGVAASWSTGTAGACSCSGKATRTVQCMQGSTVVADSTCTAAKPATSVSCTIPNSCAAWTSGTAGACSCAGMATRTVQCTLNSAVVADSTCTAVKPATSVSCTKPASCSPSSSSSSTGSAPAATYSWKAGAAGACSCSGTATRSVQCVRDGSTMVVADSICSATTKLPTSVSCTKPGSCTPPVTPVERAQLVRITFELQVSDVTAQWQQSLLQLLSTRLGVDMRRLSIVSVASGSVIVIFAIAPPLSADSSDQQSAADAVQSFLQQYADPSSLLRTSPLMAAASTDNAPASTAASTCADGQVRASCEETSSTGSEQPSTSGSAGTSSSSSSTGSVSPPPPATPTKDTQLVRVKFDLQVGDVTQEWTDKLLALLATRLGVSVKRLSIVSVASGSAFVTFAIAPPLSSASSEPSAADAAQSFQVQYANTASPLRTSPLMQDASTDSAPVNTAASTCEDGQVRESCEVSSSAASSSSGSGSLLPVWAWIAIGCGGGALLLFGASALVVRHRRRADAALKSMSQFSGTGAAGGYTSYNSPPARAAAQGHTDEGLARNPAYGAGQTDQWQQI